MHGTELRSGSARTPRRSAPRNASSPRCGSTPPGASQAAFPQNPSLVAAFYSPATAAPFGASIPGSKLPACYFSPAANLIPARSAPGSTTPTGLPQPGPLQCLSPVAVCRPAAPGILPASTPLRGCCTLPDQSVLQGHLPGGPPSGYARCPSLPAADSITSSGCGSTFRVRYVSGGLLFLKPLGTSTIMLPTGFSVNIYLM
jgi:hypothetical protein